MKNCVVTFHLSAAGHAQPLTHYTYGIGRGQGPFVVRSLSVLDSKRLDCDRDRESDSWLSIKFTTSVGRYIL